MTFPITENARNAANQTNVKPIIVMEIDGIPYRFGSATIKTKIKIGDEGLQINNYLGDPWVIGGYRKLENQYDYISFEGGGAAQITQSLRPDKGSGVSVSRFNIFLIDKNEEISKLISPGFIVNEILGRNVRIYQGFDSTGFPEDYITLFRGTIAEVESGAGMINFRLSDIEEKKRQGIYRKRITELNQTILAGDTPTTLTLIDASDFISNITGPDGSIDSILSYYVRINDEIFRYTGRTGNTLTGVTRAQLGTFAEDHDPGDTVTTIHRFQENGIHLALKFMLSGQNGFYVEDIAIKSFNFINISLTVPNAVYIADRNIVENYGITVGDYVTITGASNGANNVSAKQILDISQTDSGTYLVLDSTLVTETGSSALMKIRSKYDTLPEGLALKPFEVDVAEHERIYSLFTSNFDYDFRIEDIDNTKEFLDEQIYLPMSAFGIPRKGKASIGYMIGPIPGSNIKILDASNIKNPDKLVLQRSVNENFANTVRYNTDYNLIKDDFEAVHEFEDAQSKIDIPIGDKTQEIDSLGLTSNTQAATRAQQAANRRLKRFGRGAEYLQGVEILYGVGYNLEITDIVLFDTSALKVTDTSEGSRAGTLKFMEVTNKVLDNKRGIIKVDLLNTSIDVGERYGLISPASLIRSAANTSQFTIKKSFHTTLFNEGRKWEDLIGASIKIRSSDFATVSTDAVITGVSGDTITVSPPLNFIPSADQIMELSNYDLQPDLIKALYAFYSDGTNNFADGNPPYVLL